jgi:two-component system, chemotaxis family, chemotaxis protein CheY
MSNPTDLKFLVVDDFSTMRRIVRGLLKEMGCNNCEEAEDGQVALNMLKAAKFDFVVSDINMPNIVLAAQSGAAGYIVKPFTKATLEEKVQKIMQKLAATA